MVKRTVGAGFSRRGRTIVRLKPAPTFAALVIFSLCISLFAVEKEPLQEYRARRARVAAKANGGVVVLFGSPDKELVKFQQEANFYYLTGFDEPDAILVIDASAIPEHDYLFLKPRD